MANNYFSDGIDNTPRRIDDYWGEIDDSPWRLIIAGVERIKHQGGLIIRHVDLMIAQRK